MVQGNFSTIAKIQQALEREESRLSLSQKAELVCSCGRNLSELRFDFVKQSKNYWLLCRIHRRERRWIWSTPARPPAAKKTQITALTLWRLANRSQLLQSLTTPTARDLLIAVIDENGGGPRVRLRERQRPKKAELAEYLTSSRDPGKAIYGRRLTPAAWVQGIWCGLGCAHVSIP